MTHAMAFIPLADCPTNKKQTVPGSVNTSFGKCYVLCTNQEEALLCPDKYGLMYDIHTLLVKAAEDDTFTGVCINPYGGHPCLIPREYIIKRYSGGEAEASRVET